MTKKHIFHDVRERTITNDIQNITGDPELQQAYVITGVRGSGKTVMMMRFPQR